MDPRRHSHHDLTGHETHDEMQVVPDSALERIPNEGSQTPDNTPGFSNNGDSQPASISSSVPPPPSTASTSSSQNEPSHQTPHTSLRTSTRRSRVEDDHDDDRDRRHPSERLTTPSHPINIPQPSASPPLPPLSQLAGFLSSNPTSSPPLTNPRPQPFHFFRHIIPSNFSTQTPSHQPSQPSQDGATVAPITSTIPSTTSAPPLPLNNPISNLDGARHQTSPPLPRPQYIGGFSIIIDVNSGIPTSPVPGPPLFTMFPNANAAEGNTTGLTQAPRENVAPTGQQGMGEPAQTPLQSQSQAQPNGATASSSNPQDGGASFADILTRLSLLAALSPRDFGLFERDIDDPERAKKLVEGLEDVPVGLVRRLERLGKTNDIEGSGVGGLGDGGCAICLERLLIEGDEPDQANSEKEAEKAPHSMETDTNEQDMDVSIPSSASQTEDSKADTQYQRIVTLPCAHVFHAQCLIPWFSKPRQTTCPICRFNIDPENITRTTRTPWGTGARFQTQEQRGEGRAANVSPDEGGVGNGAEPGEGPEIVGFNIPMMFGTGPGEPIVTPIRGEGHAAQPTDPAPQSTGTVPGSAEVPPTVGTSATSGDTTTNGNGTPPTTTTNNNNNRPHTDIITIGFDMYIGRGPPPFAFQGPDVIQIPIPHNSNSNTTNTDANTPAPAHANDSTSAATNPNGSDTTGPTNGSDSATATGPGGVAGAAGTTFAIPLAMGGGFGRLISDMLSRIISGGLPPRPDGNTEGRADGPPQAQTPNQPQGPTVFGPERPHTAPFPNAIPIPGGVGLGPGTGPLGGLGSQGVHILLPFGNRGPGTNLPQQHTPGQGATDTLPPFDIVPGLFGSPSTQTNGPAQAQANAQQPGGTGASTQTRSLFTQSPFLNTNTPGLPPRFGGFEFPWMSPPRPESAPTPRQQGPRKQWTPPPAPGLTLRQKVEKREQEAGLRCCDVSCGVGPSDEDPWVDISDQELKQLSIRRSPSPAPEPKVDVHSSFGLEQFEREGEQVDVDNGAETGKEVPRSACPHTFHSSCLVSSERVALALRDAEVAFVGPDGQKEVEVSCPVCRGAGRVSKEEWDAGVEALS